MTGVFISYAREDLPFARRLHDALSAAGRDPAWDQDHAVVPFGAAYKSEIAGAIAGSEKFIFVISPDSLASGPCAAEVAAAVGSGKQIIPLLRRPAGPGQPVDETIAERNWIFFDEDSRFEASLGQLIETLDTDLEWVKAHTRLLVRAREWADGGDRSRLLRGRDLRAAEAWLADGDAHPLAPPASGQCAFITASRRAADRTAWLQRTVLTIGLVIAVALASIALVQRDQAIRQRNLAIYSQTVEEALRFGTTDTPLAALLNVAAYHMQQTQDQVSRLLSTENTPLSFPLASGTGSVFSVAFSPDGHTLASSDAHGTVRLWDVASPAHPRLLGQSLTGRTGTVPSVAFSPDGHTLASGDYVGTVRLWDLADPAHPRLLGQPLTAGTSLVYSVAFSPDGHTLASGDYDGTIRLWDVADPGHPRPLGQPLAVAGQAVFSVAFSPDGHTLASGAYDGTIRLWDVADPAHPRPLGQPLAVGSPVYSVAFRPDGHTLASGGYDGTVRLWDLADPAVPRPLGQLLLGGLGAVYSVAFSRDGQMLASGDGDGTAGCGTSPASRTRSWSASPWPAAAVRSVRWRSAATAARWPAATITARSGSGPCRRPCSPLITPSNRWRSARPAARWPAATITARSGCGTSPTPRIPGRSASPWPAAAAPSIR